MDNQPIPAHLTAFIESCINAARENLAKYGHITPVAFIGRNDKVLPFILPMKLARSNEEAAAFIRQFATNSRADYVFTIMEAWACESKDEQHYQETIKRYGSIANSPDGIECVIFQLETYTGIWSAVAEQKPLDDSPTRKTFGKVDMCQQVQLEGNLTQLLPPRNDHDVTH